MSEDVRISVGIRVVALALGLCGNLAAQEAATPAAPPSRQACFESHAHSQELRIDGKLLDARSQLRTCSDTACPAVLRTDCAGWLSEVEQQIPSVTLSVQVDGAAPSSLRVSVDGRPLTDKLDDSTYELDPGAHTFSFEVDGYPPQEEVVVLRQYEKRRVVQAVFRKAAPPDPSGVGPLAITPPPPAPSGEKTRPIPATVWIFGGIAVGAAAGSAVLGADALRTHSEKRDSCSPTCPESDSDRLKTQLLLADIAGGVALVSATTAVILYLTRPEVIRERPVGWQQRVRVAVTPDGGRLLLNGSF